MTRSRLLLALPALLWAAAPAGAQLLSPDRIDNVVDEVAAFERDVEDAATTELLSRRDAGYLRGRARSIRGFFNKVSRDGVSLAEAQLVRDRIAYLRARYNLPASR